MQARKILFVGLLCFVLAGCASTTESGVVGVERRQFMLVGTQQIDDMASKGYEEMKREAAKNGILDKDPAQVERVNQIIKRLIPQTAVFRKDAPGWKWESHVITTKELNAFCMPGGKMMIYTGLIDQLKLTDAEIAAVMGHEIAHALREHGRERISEEMLVQGGLQVLVATNKLDPKYATAAGSVSALLLTLPHGRKQESEADTIGVELMARAGYNPEEALSLWKKMEAAGGKAPEFLSTHPSSERRMKDIQELLPKVMPLYRK
jgi:predicted Zn-dependent protease